KLQVQFFAQALGGPAEYRGKSMKEAHRNFPVAMEDFGKVAEHLHATLLDLGVTQSLAGEIMAAIGPLAADIVNQRGDEMSSKTETAVGAHQVLDISNGMRIGLESLQTNIFLADLEYNIIYMNDRAGKTLKRIEKDIVQAFKVKAEEILGGSIHRFHKNPK